MGIKSYIKEKMTPFEIIKALLIGVAFLGVAGYMGWKAQGDNAVTPRSSLVTLKGKLVEASEVELTIQRRKSKQVEKFWELHVSTDNKEVKAVRLPVYLENKNGLPKPIKSVLQDIYEEDIEVKFDPEDGTTVPGDKATPALAYEISFKGKPVVSYEEMAKSAQKSAKEKANPLILLILAGFGLIAVTIAVVSAVIRFQRT